MIEKNFESQIRSYLESIWGLDMSLYDAKIISEREHAYSIQIIFKNKKTNSVIFLDDINYILSDNSYRIGIIQLLDKEPESKKPFFS